MNLYGCGYETILKDRSIPYCTNNLFARCTNSSLWVYNLFAAIKKTILLFVNLSKLTHPGLCSGSLTRLAWQITNVYIKVSAYYGIYLSPFIQFGLRGFPIQNEQTSKTSQSFPGMSLVLVFVNTGMDAGGPCASANDVVGREGTLWEAPCCCLTLS